ncbi:hypothetical protein [Phaffia rhodozyma]|uniref:Uncharacterized protein n=1 Tax=Phaffia rhodozyma TaxID=264483 RepID=A0A0F7SM83_PHARH|nr:hypothetical protein [Phaffia rhodozyma]
MSHSTCWLRWQNPPAAGAVELIADVLSKQYLAQPTTKFLLSLNSHRASFPTPTDTAGPSHSPGLSTRSLHTVVAHSSPYIHALIEESVPNSSSTHASNPATGSATKADLPPSSKKKQTMLSLTPPGSLHQLLAAVKSGFVVNDPGAGAGIGKQRTEGVDMGTSSLSRTRNQSTALKVDGQTFEIPYGVTSSNGTSWTGEREVEWVVKVGGISGAGGTSKGVLIEVEHHMPSSTSLLPLLYPNAIPSPTFVELQAFLVSLLPPLPDLKYSLSTDENWVDIGVSFDSPASISTATDTGTGESRTAPEVDKVELARRTAWLLIGLLRKDLLF